MLFTDQSIRLIDLDACRKCKSDTTDAVTAPYCPPEKARDILNKMAATSTSTSTASLKADYSFDMWSLGCIIYEMHSGHVLFDVEDIETSTGGIKRGPGESERDLLLRFLAEGVTAEWIEIRIKPLERDVCSLLRRVLCINPRERLQAKDAMSQAYFKGGLTATQATDISSVSLLLFFSMGSFLIFVSMRMNE